MYINFHSFLCFIYILYNLTIISSFKLKPSINSIINTKKYLSNSSDNYKNVPNSMNKFLLPNIMKSSLITFITMSSFIANSYADDNKIGSKTDKSFELCISKCVFQETKPPPVGSDSDRLEAKKTRSEIIKECRIKCAKTNEQLLLGIPKKK